MRKVKNVWYTDEGYSITVRLSQFNKDIRYKGYAASCQYRFSKKDGKYMVRMWLMRPTSGKKFKIEYEEIDTQLLSGTRDTIRENICRVVEQMMMNGNFDQFIDQYEYDMKCCEKGAEIFDAEDMTA